MTLTAPSDATLVRIFIGDDDTYGDKPLYDAIVLTARAMGMAGATVTRGILAYGPGSAALGIRLRLSEDAPIIVEIADAEEKIMAFLAAVDGMIDCGLVTLQKVSVIRYGRKAG